jgi:predicted amidohydrolase
MRVAAVQMHCRPDRAENLGVAAALVAQAARDQAELVVLPELFASLGTGRSMRDAAEPVHGPTVDWASELARHHRLWVAAGSFVERDGDQIFNTAPLLDPDGQLVATYRKVHLFDVEVDGAGMHESEVFSAGATATVVPVVGTHVGLTTCYDVRFPELYRALTLQGAEIVTLPSAFTAVTGAAHWEPLVRARAIENQVFVVAPDQCGTSPDGVARHGHSMIIGPWGDVLAARADGEGVIVADLDLAAVASARSAVPNLANRRPDVYGVDPSST